MTLPEAAPPEPRMSPPTDTAPPPKRSSNLETGATLVKVGAIVGIVLTALSLLYLPFVLAVGSMASSAGPGMGAFVGFMVLILVVFLALQVVGLVLSFQGRRIALDGDPARGWSRSLVGGILLVVGNLLAAILIIIGAVMMRPEQN